MATQATPADDAYRHAVNEFGNAVQLLHQGRYEEAKTKLAALENNDFDEPVLAERARTFRRICDSKLAGSADGPRSAEDRYLAGVVALNDGRLDEAITLLDQALRENPASAKFFYARASAHALQGNTEAAVGDLRQCIAIDPQTRFQAVNDSDFERVREEPSFIDIIEPTPTGA